MATPGLRAVTVMFCCQTVSPHKDSAPYANCNFLFGVGPSRRMRSSRSAEPSWMLRTNASANTRKPSAARPSNSDAAVPDGIYHISSQRGIKGCPARGSFCTTGTNRASPSDCCHLPAPAIRRQCPNLIFILQASPSSSPHLPMSPCCHPRISLTPAHTGVVRGTYHNVRHCFSRLRYRVPGACNMGYTVAPWRTRPRPRNWKSESALCPRVLGGYSYRARAWHTPIPHTSADSSYFCPAQTWTLEMQGG